MSDTPAEAESVVLTATEAAAEFRLPEEDASVLVGSGVRVSRAWLEGYRARTGPLDFTIADCAMLTGTPAKTIHRWRRDGLLKIRATAKGPTDRILVAPAELVRVLREIATARGGQAAPTETPAQQRKRGEDDRKAAMRACGID